MKSPNEKTGPASLAGPGGRLVAAPWSDPSSLSLLLSNLFTIVVALAQRWDLLSIMWVYWGQSVVIGLVNFWRMMTLKRFSTSGFTSNGKPVPETRSGQVSTAFFFLFHYGFFHLGYLVFLTIGAARAKASTETADPRVILLCVLGFLVNHVYSFLHNRERDAERKPNLGTIMFLPYARIVPMHLTIVLGAALAGSRWTLLLFLGLKTAADLVMHAVEHRGSDYPGTGRPAAV